MKDDEKKSQREDMQFPDEEDMDFEILDALEHLDQSSSGQSPDISDETIELTLDDEDMDFGENTSDTGNGFSFDESLREGLEQELLQNTGLDLEESLEDDLVKQIQAEEGKDSFAVDLDLDENPFDKEEATESDDSTFDMSAAETLAFNYNKQGSKAKMRSLENEDADELGSYDLDLGSESEDIDLESFSSQDEDFPELDLGIEGVEISDEFADLGADIKLEPPQEQEPEYENIPAKGVITVGDDEVLDLGDEEHLMHKEPPESDEEEDTPQVTTETELSLPEPVAEQTEPAESDIALDLHEEDDNDEDFMSSIDDIKIDLKPETEVGGEESGNMPEEEKKTTEASVEHEDAKLETFAEKEPTEAEDMDMADLVNEALEAQERKEVQKESETSEEEELESLMPEEDTEPKAEDMPEEAPGEEIDVREFLALSLRLSDEQIEEFEAMVNEAKTLQAYLDELEEHHSDVKETIYHKLQVEYIARKTVIFKSEEFTALLGDVEQDLEDMVAKRTDFVDTVARLNEELEEIKVRHLVGEYDDSTLSEKQESQNAEIALWNEKTEKIEVFITRYQESLEAEKALNPLRKEQIEEGPAEEELPQAPEVADTEEAGERVEAGLEEETINEAEEDTERFAVEEEEEAEAKAKEQGEEEKTNKEEEENSVSLPEIESLEETEASEEELEGESAIEDFFSSSEGDEEFDEEFPVGGDFETGDFVLDDLSGFEEDEEEEEEPSVSYVGEGFDDEETEAAGAEEGDTIECSKCGRQTPAAEKFCVHCGGKAQKAKQEAAVVSCKKCGRQTPATEKFCVHCGGKAQ